MEQQPTNPQRPMVDDVKPPVSETPKIPTDVAASIQEAPPAAPVAQANVKQPPAEESSEVSAETKPEDPAPEPEPSSTKTSSATNKRPLAMVVVVLLVGLSLAGLSVFAYMMTNNNTDETAANSSATSSQTAPAVTEVTEDIDQALEALDPDAEFSETELSDETLGL